MMKRVFALLMALVLVLPWLPQLPADAYPTSYQLSRDGLWGYDFMEKEILAYFGDAEHVTIPSTIDGHIMYYINGGLFSDQQNLKSVDLNYIKAVSGSAFYNCKNLKTVTGRFAVEIKGSAFKNCTSLEKLDVEIAGTTIGNNAFENCTSLKEITIPDNITTIEKYAFKGCTSLKSVQLHKEITTLGNGAFYGCTSLDGIWAAQDSPKYANDEHGVLLSKDKVGLIAAPGGLTGTYTAPDTVRVLSAEAFGGCGKLEAINLPDLVVDAGEGTFENCTSLKNFTIPTSLTTLRERLFQGCTSLKTITLHKNVKNVKEGAFRGCASMTGIYAVKDNQRFVHDGSGVLYNINRTNLVAAPGALTGTYVVLSTVTTLSNGAFADCKNLKTVLIPDKVTIIPRRCFENCTALRTAVLPGKSEILEAAFRNCSSLDSIVIHDINGVYGSNAFENCTALKNIYNPMCMNDYAYAFKNVTANMYYLQSKAYYTQEQLQNKQFSGKLTWIPLDSYCVAKGDNSTYTVGSDIGAIFLMMADWNKLSAVRVDGQELGSNQYLSMSRGTAVILKDAYLKTLPLGEHSLEVVYTDGSCTASFTLKEPCVHNTVKLPAVTATCTKTGLTEGSHCTKCGEVFVVQQTVDALGHSYSSTNYAATCTEGGYNLAKCSRCGKTERSNETAPLGHHFSDWEIVKNPTIQEPGIQSRRCESCGKTEEKSIDPITAPPVEQPTEPPVEQPTEPPVEQPTEPPTEKPTEPPIEQPSEPNSTEPSKPSGTIPSATEPSSTERNQADEPKNENLVPWIIVGGVLLVITAAGALYLLRKKS